MKEIDKILVAVDLLKSTKALLKYAIEMAIYTDAELVMLHVVDHQNKIKVDEDPKKSIIANTKLLSEKSEQLESMLERFNTKHGQKISVISRIGFIHRQITEVADEEDVDLIMLGKKSKGTFLTFERTIDEVISIASKPVLIVPDNIVFHPFNNKLYTTDFLYDDSKSINFMQNFNGRTTCLHINQDTNESMMTNKKMEVLKGIYNNDNFQFVIQKGNAPVAILDYASEIKADLIGLTHKQRGLWNYFFQASVCKSIVKRSKVPSIIFQQI